MDSTVNLSLTDRSLIASLTESNNRLAEAIERQSRKEDYLLTPTQAAAYLGRNISTISRMLADGRLHKVYEGGLSGIRRSELDKYLKP